MNTKPMTDHVILRRHEAEESSAGGIILPDNEQVPENKATVLAVGPGRVLDNGVLLEVPVQVGEVVIFKDGFGVTKDKIEGEDVLITREASILAVIE